MVNLAVANYLKNVLSKVKCKKIHSALEEELIDHIECIKESYIEEGMDETLAYKKAVEQMGCAAEVGKDLNKAHAYHMEWSVLALLIGIVTIGVGAFVYWNIQTTQGEIAYYFGRQVVFIGLGILGFIGAYFFDYRYLKKWSVWIYGIALLLLVYNKFFGIDVNGSRSWIRIGSLSIGVYTMVIPTLIVGYIGLIKCFAKERSKDYFVLGIVGILPIILIMDEQFRSAFLLGIIFLLIVTSHILSKDFDGNRKQFLTILYSLTGGVGIFGAFWYLQAPYRKARIDVFLSPEQDPVGMGYIPMQLKNVREQASLLGDSGFQVVSANVPDPFGDYMLTVIIGCFGWFIAAILIIMVAMMIIRMYKVAWKIQDSYGKLLCIGIVSLFTIQFFYNIGMNLGYLPLIGISLPFVSYGGTGMVMNFVLMGLFLNIYRKKDVVLLDNSVVG